jgi:hypothetical protein
VPGGDRRSFKFRWTVDVRGSGAGLGFSICGLRSQNGRNVARNDARPFTGGSLTKEPGMLKPGCTQCRLV